MQQLMAKLDFWGKNLLLLKNKFIFYPSFVADNGTTAGCPEKREFCGSHPCRNGGSCKEGWSTYKCDCASGFGGKDCSDCKYLMHK